MQTEFGMWCQGTRTTPKACVNKGDFKIPLYSLDGCLGTDSAPVITKRSLSADEGRSRVQLRMKYKGSRKI